MNPKYTCRFCNKEFSNKFNLSKHILVCKRKEIVELQESNCFLHQELAQERDRHREELAQERDAHERERHALELRIEKLENQLFEIAKQPHSVHHNMTTTTTQTNNRTLNVINQLGTYDFDEKQIEQILHENFTEDIFLGGPDRIAELAAHFLLTDGDTRKPKVVCTDVSRKTYRYVNQQTQELQVDPGFQKTHRLIKRPLGEANLRVFVDSFLQSDSDDAHRKQWETNDRFIADCGGFSDKVVTHLV